MNFLCPLECGNKIKSFYNHYTKCKRKDLLDIEYLKCKNDYNHIVKKENYEMHLETCNKQSDIEHSEESDSGDLIKILNKISKQKKIIDSEEETQTTPTEIQIIKSYTFFDCEEEIDNDSKIFYEFIYGKNRFNII